MKDIWEKQKERAYKYLYEFTKAQCDDCAKTDCACKDTICEHVETQAKLKGVSFSKPGQRLRFLSCDGCVVPPHYRETCTIYLCEPAKQKVSFNRKKYERLVSLCARLEEKLMG